MRYRQQILIDAMRSQAVKWTEAAGLRRCADHDLLATPVGGVLHLAGEVTWTDDPATVAAALHSGHLDRGVWGGA